MAMKAVLTGLREEDKKFLFDLVNDREITAYNSHYAPVDWETHCAWFERAGSDKTKRVFSILIEPDGEFAGRLDLKNIHAVNRSAELTINLLAPHRGKGFGAQALAQAMDIAWNELDLNRIYLHVMSSNERAILLYKSAGFEREGTLRSHIYADGKFHDFDIMAVLRPEKL